MISFDLFFFFLFFLGSTVLETSDFPSAATYSVPFFLRPPLQYINALVNANIQCTPRATLQNCDELAFIKAKAFLILIHLAINACVYVGVGE